ncbi:MAG: hypothetical protein IPN03_23095 [Holophagales bacterium]|nr:hypothetical protein [Holophagales bacterium]
MTVPMSEEITVHATTGTVEVKGADFDSLLRIGSTLVAYQWRDLEGSVAQYLIQRASAEPLLDVLAFRHSVETWPTSGTSLSGHFSQVVSLLAPGRYRLAVSDAWQDVEYVALDPTDCGERAFKHFYAGCGALVATQSSTTIRASLVRDYVNQIEAGHRPLVITIAAFEGWSEFILDGHHKVLAYLQLRLPIPRLSIVRLGAPVLRTEALSAVPLFHPLRCHLEENKDVPES